LCLRWTLVLLCWLSFYPSSYSHSLLSVVYSMCCQWCIVCIMTGSLNKQQTKRTNDLAGCILASPDIVTLHLQSVRKALILGLCVVTVNSLGDTY
jgi:hypothetical protein